MVTKQSEDSSDNQNLSIAFEQLQSLLQRQEHFKRSCGQIENSTVIQYVIVNKILQNAYSSILQTSIYLMVLQWMAFCTVLPIQITCVNTVVKRPLGILWTSWATKLASKGSIECSRMWVFRQRLQGAMFSCQMWLLGCTSIQEVSGLLSRNI